MKKWIVKAWQYLRRNWKPIVFWTLIVANILVWYAVARETRNGILTVAFLDVGQGDSIYIESPTGNQILIDSGPDGAVLRSLSAVMPFYDHSFDALLLTHPHADHLRGFLDVLPRYLVGAVLASGASSTASEYSVWKNNEASAGIKELALSRGASADLGGGVFLDVLYPAARTAGNGPHDKMLVTRLRYGETSFLFEGDAEQSIESRLVGFCDWQNGVRPLGEGGQTPFCPSLKSDVLKVAHHGSLTSSSDAFIKAVAPRYAVISAGAGNQFGLPKQAIVERLRAGGAEVLRTDEKGTIVFTSNGIKIQNIEYRR